MEYNFINKLSIDELKDIEKILDNESLRQDLKSDIKRIIAIYEDNKLNLDSYNAKNIPYFDSDLEERCLALLDDLELQEFYFLIRSFADKGNINTLYADKGALLYLADCYKITVYNLIRVLQTSNSFGYKMSLSVLEKFFDEGNSVKNYKNTFNIYNYIKSYIYQCLRQDCDCTKEMIFKDYGLKQVIVENHLQEVASYLYDLRGDKLRCSIGNAGLSRTAKKVSGQVTIHQKRLIEAVAFGTTLEKLKNRNYEDSKKLIYLP